ncbi:putative disease resistance protein RGA3 isoform X2 [Lycium barbarum]|uniref:putative disease resistance protein RGA3 isoform X1 n=2 Tax=Lycium barbarum TaxID=112863 RepID=UPI00293E0EF2|nr:putative disease resistance protein RGA3 isoform X1 [Lycium barbarum]XP_060217435.1 putative disease resistance protein RGA3 isoform X2 [Lycium barbarum]
MAEAVLSALMEVLFQKIAPQIFPKNGLLASTKKEMLNLQSTLSTIQGVLQDAEDRQMKEKALKNWLVKLKDIVYEADDLLDEYMTELLRHKVILDDQETRYCVFYAVSSLYLDGTLLFLGYRMKLKLKEVGEKLDLVANERAKFHFRDVVCQKSLSCERPQSDSYVIESKILGRNKDKENIIKLLIESDVSVVSIVGIGGIGKTTVAKLVYNDAVVENSFDTRIWVCVSEGFDVKRLLKAIIESGTGSSCNLVEMDAIQRRVQQLMLGKKCLLILDDVWDDDHEKYERLKNLVHNGLDGSKLLVTTRNEKVALLMGTTNPYHLEGLSDGDCWSLFRELAYKNRQEELLALEEVGKEIAKKCKGVPLAAKALGSLMCLKNQKSEWSFIRDCAMWDLMGHDDGAGILSALRLSYEYLPTHLKQCFAYCSIFPKGYRINKNTLICLWMAEGFVPSSESMPPEELGNGYFNELLWRSFFQNVRRDFDGNIVECDMHDLVHDLAKSVGGVDCLTIEFGKEVIIPVATRHLSMFGNEMVPKEPGMLKSAQKLRSFLLLDGQRNVTKLSKSFFLSFKSIRALDCSGSRIKKLSNSIGTLLHLRYLNLSDTLLKTLPKSICCLLNLEALILKHCNHLIELPAETRKLVNLRHLDIYGCTSLTMLPRGIGQMRSLQTLPVYIVNNAAASDVSELQRLDLHGELMIKNLENLSNEIYAKNVNLKGKRHIRSLKLIWEQVEEMETRENVERVVESLQPNSDLRKLHIEGYIGANFPSWLMTTYLVHIVELWLLKCHRCVELPQLGKLPFLEVLTVDEMDSAMYFCDSSGEKDWATNFASLKQLTVRNMPNLLGWSVNEDHSILPCLKKFMCEACPYLNNLPDLPCLDSLELSDCSSALLAVTAAKVTSLTHLMISGLGLLHLPEGLLKNNINLSSVEIRDCPEIQSLSSELKVLPCLESLSISNCNNLSSVLDSSGLGTLKSLSIHGCPNINLEKGLQSLQLLQYASLSECENLTILPMTMQHLTSLQTLHIWSCPEMYMLPEWLGDLISLRDLELWYCGNLSSLPESVKKLTKLQFLSIWGCPNLGLRCRKDVGEDWHKIQHVPFIKINGPYIQAMTGYP